MDLLPVPALFLPFADFFTGSLFVGVAEGFSLAGGRGVPLGVERVCEDCEAVCWVVEVVVVTVCVVVEPLMFTEGRRCPVTGVAEDSD